MCVSSNRSGRLTGVVNSHVFKKKVAQHDAIRKAPTFLAFSHFGVKSDPSVTMYGSAKRSQED